MKIRPWTAANLFGLFAFFVSTPVRAFQITPVGTFELSDLFNPPGSSTGTGWGYGVMLGQSIHPDVEIESGVLYMARVSNQGNPTSVTSTYQYEEVPLLVRSGLRGVIAVSDSEVTTPTASVIFKINHRPDKPIQAMRTCRCHGRITEPLRPLGFAGNSPGSWVSMRTRVSRMV